MVDWSRFLKVLSGTVGWLLALSVVVVFVGNPYGNIVVSPLRHVLMDDNQRFQYPAVVRSGRYNSIVIGTSTSRLLNPAQLDAKLGGQFANLALNSGTAWEQWRFARLFAAKTPARRTLLIGLDHVWCEATADSERITARGFPEWMFDDNPWNDLTYLLNARAIEISGRRIGHALGFVKERWPHNGYEVFVPPESTYDVVRARQNIYQSRPAKRPVREAAAGNAKALRPDGFPALTWLESLLDRSVEAWPHVIVLIVPIHVAAMPRAGTLSGTREANCKLEVAAMAKRHARPVVDLRIPSPLTTRDENFWDGVHYRVPIADRIADHLVQALANGVDDPQGEWRVLAPPVAGGR